MMQPPYWEGETFSLHLLSSQVRPRPIYLSPEDLESDGPAMQTTLTFRPRTREMPATFESTLVHRPHTRETPFTFEASLA